MRAFLVSATVVAASSVGGSAGTEGTEVTKWQGSPATAIGAVPVRLVAAMTCLLVPSQECQWKSVRSS